MSRDQEIRDVAAALEGLLDELQDTVSALNTILVPPAGDGHPDGQEVPVP